MRRVFLWLFNGWAALSLLLCVMAATMWLRSCWQHDHIQIRGNWYFDSDGYSVAIGKWEQLPRVPAEGAMRNYWVRQLSPPRATTGPSDHFTKMREDTLKSLQAPQAPWPTVTAMVSGTRISYSSVFAGCGMMPLVWLLRKELERQRKLRIGRWCLTCGYDLRASPERCPECGTPVPAPIHSSAEPLA